jgi:hypothetical protein
MSQSLKRNAHFLKLLHEASPRVRSELLRIHCTPDFVKCVSECCFNLLKGNVPMTQHQKDSLRHRKQMLRLLMHKKTPLKKKKQIIQKGGFLGALIGPVISMLGKVLGFGSGDG